MTRRRRVTRAVLLLGGGIAIGASVAPAHAQTVGYTASLYTVRGTYAGAETDGLYVFNAVDVSGGPIRVALTVPWGRTESTATLLDDVGVPTPTSYTSTGMGDPVARADLRLVRDRSGSFQFGVAGAVKMAVVDVTTGRGTGETDLAAGATAFKMVNRTSLMADVMFWHYGDPADVDFDDTWSYSVGVAQMLGDAGRWSVMGSLSGFTTGLDGEPPPRSFTLGLLALAGRRQSIAVSTSLGLNDSASDFSLGVSWRVTWQPRARTP